MSQCFRCSKLCEANAAFCDECRSLLPNQLQQRPFSHASQVPSSTASTPEDTPTLPEHDAVQGDSSEHTTSPLPIVEADQTPLPAALVTHEDLVEPEDTPTLPEHNSVQGDPSEHITSPLPIVEADQTPQPAALVTHEDLVEQAVSMLNEAAQRIAEGEDPAKSDRKARLYSRVSRLRPIPDISADIRRESTPLLQVSSSQPDEPVSVSKRGIERQWSTGDSPGQVDFDADLPDLWPWFDADIEEKDNDIWAGRTDPLISRHFPNSAESARIEEEDIRRARAEGVTTGPYPISPRHRYSPRMRIAFTALALFAFVALAIDGVLLGFTFIHQHHTVGTPSGPPTLILSQNSATIGQTIQLSIQHFTSLTSVALTHDIQEPIQVNQGSSLVKINSSGWAKVALVITNDWDSGFHLIVAEDVATHYTASATLQITGGSPMPPPHLLIDTRPLNLGSAVIGANTIYHFKLTNSGGGSITWSASSHQSWLLVAPSQGIFNDSQVISIAVQRVGLKPGDYKGDLAFSSNVSPTEHVEVDMAVQPLPPNAGPVIALSPALLSFTAIDGQSNISAQSLTISNPGSRTLYWSLTSNNPATATTQSSLLHALGPGGNWLSATPTSGIVAPGATSTIQVIVNSQSVLPGVYIGTLLFTATAGAIDSPQSVDVSLTVSPHCGIATSSGYLSLNAVEGQSNPGNQALSLNATVSCAGTAVNWWTSSTPSWLTVTPSRGQLKGTASTVVSFSVNTGGLAPNTYTGAISFVTGQATQTVIVQLFVQSSPAPAEPVMGASPLSLNFSNTRGLPNPTGQVVTITNNGSSPLRWNTNINLLAGSWLGVAPSGGTVAPGQTGQVTINVNTAQLIPGNYIGQVILNGYDAKGHIAPGSPQTVTINLVMQPPCAISQPSAGSLSFSAVQGTATGLTPQTVMFTGTGSCVWPVTWSTKVAPAASWLTLTPASNSIKGTGQSGSISVAVSIAGLPAGTYSTQVTLSAADASGAPTQGSLETFSVALSILPPPCALSPLPASLAFAVAQGQTASTQNVPLSEAGTCARPVSWTATADAASSSWLVLTPASGTDSGSGSTLSVNVNTTSLIPGTYSGTISISATDSAGVAVSGSPQTIPVTLTVTGFTISGSIVACSGPAPTCTTSQPLSGATVALMSGSTTIMTVVANASGNFSLPNVAPGTYIISASGTDSNNNPYHGSTTVIVTGDTTGVSVNTFPG